MRARVLIESGDGRPVDQTAIATGRMKFKVDAGTDSVPMSSKGFVCTPPMVSTLTCKAVDLGKILAFSGGPGRAAGQSVGDEVSGRFKILLFLQDW